MGPPERIPLVRCHLDGPEEATAARLRYVPLAEFEMWRHLMESRHHRQVTVEVVSVWISEEPTVWNSGFEPDDLEPVLRVRIERPGPHGVPVLVERYFPAETYPLAQERLLSHIAGVSLGAGVIATPGYFVPADAGNPARRKLALAC